MLCEHVDGDWGVPCAEGFFLMNEVAYGLPCDTRMPRSPAWTRYCEWYACLTLETRRIRGDQIEVFKIMHGDMFFRIKNDSRTRGHSLALVKCHSRLDIRKYTFSQRVVNDWNKLPEECINSTSVK